MADNGPYYKSSDMAARWIVEFFSTGTPKEFLYNRILYTILYAMQDAEAEINAKRFEPSRN